MGIGNAETVTMPVDLPPLSSSETVQQEPDNKSGMDIFVDFVMMGNAERIKIDFNDSQVLLYETDIEMKNQQDYGFQAGVFLSDKDSDDLFMFRIEYQPINLYEHFFNSYYMKTYRAEVTGSIIFADFAFGNKIGKSAKIYYGFGLGYGNRKDELLESLYPGVKESASSEEMAFLTGKLFVGLDYKIIPGVHIFAEPTIFSFNDTATGAQFSFNFGGRLVF